MSFTYSRILPKRLYTTVNSYTSTAMKVHCAIFSPQPHLKFCNQSQCSSTLDLHKIFIVSFTVFTRSLIVKRQIASISRRELFRCDEAFENEIAAYRYLIPVFRKHYPHQVPYPICLFAGKDCDGEVVILEDLCESGYQMVNRLQGLDYDHCKIVVKV